ncbi:hypothetical protein [Lampropedia aestuarii]|uniref:hypothetical protein n=1 Tax=Lampropedia aestuarii TaxID=2562762 RepID=UPI0024690EB8|nr:hypothetical protein [Lampropedia aestuarii]MDH5857350.1 hypothetical protein [Lampropedia aestuarii]
MMSNNRVWAILGLACLCLSAVILLAVAAMPLRDLAMREAQGRARLVGSAVTAQIQHALDLNIPIRELVGIESLFEQNVQSFPDLLRIELRDRSGDLLYEAGHAREGLGAPDIEMPLHEHHSQAGQVVVHWRSVNLSDFIRSSGLPLLALMAFALVLLREALRMALACYPASREALVRTACMRIQAGELDFAIASTGRRDYDARPQWLAARLRHVREQYQRLERITLSLLRTEPDERIRQELEQGLQDARGNDRIQVQAQLWLTGTGAQARQRWHGVLLGMLVWLPLAIPIGGGVRLIQVALPVVCLLLLLVWLPSLLGWEQKAASRGMLLGGVLLGPGLALLLQMAFAPAFLNGTNPQVNMVLMLQTALALGAGLWPEKSQPKEACDVS